MVDLSKFFLSREEHQKIKADVERAHLPKIIGIDVGGDEWAAEVVNEVMPDGKLRVVSVHRYKRTIDL